VEDGSGYARSRSGNHSKDSVSPASLDVDALPLVLVFRGPGFSRGRSYLRPLV